VKDFGATGDGATFDTIAIQKAIDACAGTGGSVIVDAGQYVCAPIELKARMTFHLKAGAVLLGSLNPADYPTRLPPQTSAGGLQRSLIFAYQADDLVLEGPGEINGRGRELAMDGLEGDRPSLMRIYSSKKVTVRNITFRNPRMWTCIYSECDDVLIEGTVTDSPAYCANLDGMDICDCWNVVIRNNFVSSEDDGICLKSRNSRGLKNILVENNSVLCHRANAIKLGTGTKGPMENLRILNNTVYGAKYGGLCLESVDGGALKDVLVRGLDMYRVGQPIYIRLDHRKPDAKNKGPLVTTGSIEGIAIERVRALGTHALTKSSISPICGIPEARIKGVTLRDIFIQVPGGLDKVPTHPGDRSGGYPQSNQFGDTPAGIFYLRHVDQVKFERVQYEFLKPDVRPWLVSVNETEVTTTDCKEVHTSLTMPPVPEIPNLAVTP
jgi:polygalacturonase